MTSKASVAVATVFRKVPELMKTGLEPPTRAKPAEPRHSNSPLLLMVVRSQRVNAFELSRTTVPAFSRVVSWLNVQMLLPVISNVLPALCASVPAMAPPDQVQFPSKQPLPLTSPELRVSRPLTAILPAMLTVAPSTSARPGPTMDDPSLKVCVPEMKLREFETTSRTPLLLKMTFRVRAVSPGPSFRKVPVLLNVGVPPLR